MQESQCKEGFEAPNPCEKGQHILSEVGLSMVAAAEPVDTSGGFLACSNRPLCGLTVIRKAVLNAAFHETTVFSCDLSSLLKIPPS